MKVLLDSSTLIAAMLPDHVHHAEAAAWLTAAKSGTYDYLVSGHTLAEVYSVLTRLPRTPKIHVSESWRLLDENVCRCATIVTLSGSDCATLIQDLSTRGIVGGQVDDGIIAKAAELAQADQLVTLNESHFHRVWPAGGHRIVSPLRQLPPSSRP